jgi:hypothetical protein
MKKNDAFPFVANDVQGGFDRAAGMAVVDASGVFRFHEAVLVFYSIFFDTIYQICAYLQYLSQYL